MDTIRLNIVILPDQKTTAKAIELSSKLHATVPTEFILDNNSYYAHITIFQLHIPKKNLNRVYEEVALVVKNIQPFLIETEDVRVSHGTFVFLGIKQSKILRELQKDIVKRINPLREGLSMVDPTLMPHLTPNDQHDAKTYGSLLIGPNFKPHITLTRLTNKNDVDTIQPFLKPLSLTSPIHAIHIGTCGAHGTVNDILKTIEFM